MKKLQGIQGPIFLFAGLLTSGGIGILTFSNPLGASEGNYLVTIKNNIDIWRSETNDG